MQDIRHIDAHELARLRECEKAWQAVFEALQAPDRGVFNGPSVAGLTGIECAVREIKRLQKVAK